MGQNSCGNHSTHQEAGWGGVAFTSCLSISLLNKEIILFQCILYHTVSVERTREKSKALDEKWWEKDLQMTVSYLKESSGLKVIND